MYKIKKRLKTMDHYGLNYLASFGVENPLNFAKGGSIEDEITPYAIPNIDRAIEQLHEGFMANKKFFVQIDSDCDGYTSSAIFVGYFKEKYPHIHFDWGIHQGKEHGIDLDAIPIASDYIIIPDAGSNDIDQQSILAEQGRKVIILDHHQCPYVFQHENVIVANNQLGIDCNRDLSGAGVVYKLIQAYDKKYFDGSTYENYADLAMLGIVADMMSSVKADTNYIINKGLSNLHNPFVCSLMEKMSFQLKGSLTKISTAFYIAPVINGVVRSGTQEEKEVMFRALTSQPTEAIITTMSGGKPRKEDYYTYAARICSNAKGRQDNLKRRITAKAMEIIEAKNAQYNKLIILNLEDLKQELPKTMTGILAMALNREYGVPVLVLRPKIENGIEKLSGSGRATTAAGFPSLMAFLKGSGLTEYCEGHNMAHGVTMKQENVEKLIDYANEKLAKIDFRIPELEVECHLEDDYSETNELMIRELAEIIDCCGNGIAMPYVSFDFQIRDQFVKVIGKKQDTIKLYWHYIEMIKFTSPELAEEILVSDGKKIRGYGKMSVNSFTGEPSIQIEGCEIY